MRYIKGLSKETLKLLKRIYKFSKFEQVRQRALVIQLSYQGYKIAELMEIVQVSRNTIYNWFNAWNKNGLVGLYDRKGRGRNQKLNIKYQQKIKQWVIRIKKIRESSVTDKPSM